MNTAYRILGSLVFLTALVFWVAPPALSDPGPDDSGGKSIEAVREELQRRREKRTQLREKLETSQPTDQRAMSGFVSLETEYRFGGHDRDLDTTFRFFVELGDDRVDSVTGSVSGRLLWDMNGLARPSGVTFGDDAAYVDYNDIEGDRLTQRIYTAYVDFNRLGPLDKLRVGRQFHDGTTGGHFDGLRVAASPFEKTTVSLYGGVPVNEYKATGRRAAENDRIYGGMITNRFLDDLSVTLDVQGYRDRTEFYGFHTDYQAALGLRYNFQDNLRGSVLENVINGEQRDLNCSLVYWNTSYDLSVTMNYVWMPERLEDLSDGYTPYTDMMARLEPYQLFRVMGTKGLGEHVEVGADFTSHELIDTTDETIFNKEYTRTQASLSLLDLPIDDLRATIHYERWDSTDDAEYSLGGDVRQRLTRSHTLEAGSYFSKFKYRNVSFVRTQDVQTTYLKWRWAVTRDLNFQLKAEIEDVVDEETYNLLSAAFTLRF